MQNVQIDMEINVNLFKHLRPDIVVLERKQKGEDIGDVLPCLKGPGKMLFVVEVKKVEQKDSKSKSATEIIPSFLQNLQPSQNGRGNMPKYRSQLF